MPKTESAKPDLASLVNLFTGTAAGTEDFGTGGGAGNTFPGAVAPFGMLQWSPDTVPSTDNVAGGYSYPDASIRGFSLTHLSGAGCATFQDVPILPTTRAVTSPPALERSYDVDPRYLPAFGHAEESAEPGSYRVVLDPGTPRAIEVELAARTRSGVGRFVFPAGADANVLFNAGGSAMANGEVRIAIDRARAEVAGSVSSGHFCYHRNRYDLHFAMRFDRPFAAWGTWEGQALSPGSQACAQQVAEPFHLRVPTAFGSPPHTSSGAQAGAWVGFAAERGAVVRARIGVSFASVEHARANLEAESPDFDLERARAETRGAWNELLARIEVAGGTPEHRRTFYTMLYHALLAPTVFSDVDGSYAGMDGRLHRADGWTKYANFSGWDIYRGEMQLLALLLPERASDMVRSLLADARESGWLPKWPVANGHTDVMVGDPAAALIASAWAFGARGFAADEALAALLKGATRTGVSDNASYVERQALDEYLRLGYVPHDGTESSSGVSTTIFGSTDTVWGSAATTLEYAVADFAIARFAAALGDRESYRDFMRRSAAWRKLFNPATGYIEPRYASGAFQQGFDPEGGEGFVEGNAAQYTWMVPFDPAGLADAMGGPDAAAERLDRHLGELNRGPHSGFAYLGNEPELGVPWLYDWLGRPWKTQRIVRKALLELFDASPDGYPGNDDLGTMSAWYVFGALGFYPAVPGEDVLALASPLFPRAVVRLHGGDLVIDAPSASPGAPYVHRLEVNGRRHDAPWIPFAALAGGAELRFELSDRPSPEWGRAASLAPPSFPPSTPFPGDRRS